MNFFKAHKYTIILVICLFMATGSCCCMLHMLGRTETVFAPPNFDESAVQGDPAESVDLPGDWSVLTDETLPFSVGVSGLPKQSKDGLLEVWFFNPATNTSWVQLQVLNGKGEVLGSSGIVKPGSYVMSIDGDFISETDILMKVLGYEPKLYYSQGSFVLHSRIL